MSGWAPVHGVWVLGSALHLELGIRRKVGDDFS